MNGVYNKDNINYYCQQYDGTAASLDPVLNMILNSPNCYLSGNALFVNNTGVTIGSILILNVYNYLAETTNDTTLADFEPGYYTPAIGGGGGSSTVTWADIQDKPNFGKLATMSSIDYTTDDILNKPTLGALASKDSIASTDIADGAITTAKIADGAIDLSSSTKISNILSAAHGGLNLNDLSTS